MAEYVLLKSHCESKLSREITEKINSGYTLYGSPTMIYVHISGCSGGFLFCQAVIKQPIAGQVVEQTPYNNLIGREYEKKTD